MIIAIFAITMAGCITPASLTTQLSPGMRPEQVRAILGAPKHAEFIEGKWVWKYDLFEPWKGQVPFYVVLSKDGEAVEGWSKNNAEWYQQQQLMLQNFSLILPQQHNVNLNVRYPPQ